MIPNATTWTPQASRVVMTELVLPEDTNTHGHIFGGRVLALADKCAAMTAMRHCRLPVVTASIDRVDFLRPIKLGMIVILTGELNATFSSSMEASVIVEAEDPITGLKLTACRALISLVALDSTGHPTKVPPLVLTSDEERERAAAAAERKAARKKLA